MVGYKKVVELLSELTDFADDPDNGIISFTVRNREAQIHVSTDCFWAVAKSFEAEVTIEPSFNAIISESEPGYKGEQYQFTVNDVTFFTIMNPEEESEYGVRVRT